MLRPGLLGGIDVEPRTQTEIVGAVRIIRHKSGEIRTRVAGNWRYVTAKPSHLDAWPVTASHPMANERSTPVSSFNRMRSAVNHACASEKEMRTKA